LIAATADQRPALARAAALFGEEDLTRFFQILLQTDDALRRAPDPRVHLEMGLLRLINAARLAPLEELVSELKGGSGGAPSSGASRGAATGLAPAAKKMFAESPSGAVHSDSVIRAEERTNVPGSRQEVRTEAAKDADPPGLSASAQFPGNFSRAADARVGQGNEDRALQTVVANSAAPATAAANASANPPLACSAEGISPQQVAEIKAAIHADKKFLGELVEQSARWQVEGAELRIFFPVERRAFADLLEGREALEKIRTAAATVLGKPVRVCTRIESLAAAAGAGAGPPQSSGRHGSSATPAVRGADQTFARSNPDESTRSAALRTHFESNPMVRAIIDRFGGKISEVRPRPAEL
jgi:DNA polymerase-3 subunit gamma/tau